MTTETKIDAKEQTVTVRETGKSLAWAKYTLAGSLLRKGDGFCAPSADQMAAFDAAAVAAIAAYVPATVAPVSRARRERTYDNLQNEGHRDAGNYNPYRGIDTDDARNDSFDSNDI